jgi:PAS domain S-box-containing protein
MGAAASPRKARAQLVANLQARLTEAEETLNAIRTGAVDALVVHTPHGEQVFTLKGADQTYRALIEALGQGTLTVTGGIISYCNQHFAEMMGRPMEHIFGAPIFEFVQTENFRRLLHRLERGKETRGSIEGVLHTAAGGRLPVLLSGSRFYSDDRVSIGVVVTDIAERKEMERVREALSRSILTAQERERQRVARDLHDSVNQLLASAKFRLHSIAAQAAKQGQVAGILQVLSMVDKAIGEVRLISRNLRPSELDDIGLAAALRTLVRDFSQRTSIATRFRNKRTASRQKLFKEAEMSLYRIVQESLNNVEKHSGARTVDLTLDGSSQNIVLTLKDDGRGMGEAKKGGSGLQNMLERAAMVGGQLDFWSVPGKGTRITVRIPLKSQTQQPTSLHA